MSIEIIPFQAAKAIADEYEQDIVVIVTYDKQDQRTHVVTYGKSIEDSDHAAAGGDLVKKALGWPGSVRNLLPPRVQKLAEAIDAALEIIKTWHAISGIGLTPEAQETAWNLYFRNSPEMQPIREALAVFGKNVPAASKELPTLGDNTVLAALNQGSCPDCKAQWSMLRGPRGGDSINIKCAKCGSEFNVRLPFFAERIGSGGKQGDADGR
jgi:hypothetical protein